MFIRAALQSKDDKTLAFHVVLQNKHFLLEIRPLSYLSLGILEQQILPNFA